MKYLKMFKKFILKQDKYGRYKNDEIDSILMHYGVTNYTINKDSSIDVEGSVMLRGKYLGQLPVIFRNVTGNFNCSDNVLTSLKGAPNHVGGNFDWS